MPSVAQWAGTPSVKGSSESMRMVLLTASLIGLQCVFQGPQLGSKAELILAVAGSHGMSK
jgi:hypothetical protein